MSRFWATDYEASAYDDGVMPADVIQTYAVQSLLERGILPGGVRGAARHRPGTPIPWAGGPSTHHRPTRAISARENLPALAPLGLPSWRGTSSTIPTIA